MLDDYRETQPLFYNIIVSSLKKDKLSHAYLIETNNNLNSEEIIKAFVKSLFCPLNFTNKKNCKDCYICDRIDNNNFLELKVIRPDGQWIKKEQLKELQKEFSMIATESNYKIYIIHEAEKMNKQAANSILKFLEEPQENIIAVLVTNNSSMILETIKSRCQVLTLNKKNIEDDDPINCIFAGIHETKISEYIDNICTFIDYFEEKKIDTILVTKKYWHNNFKTKEESQIAFDVIIHIYNDALHLKNGMELLIFKEKKELIYKIVQKNSNNTIEKKLKTFIYFRDLIKYNLNISLLIDKLIIDLEGDNNENSWSNINW